MTDEIAPAEAGREVPFSRDEVHRLREMARIPPAPWWKNYPLLIAGAGFLLSLTTAVISAHVAHRKDVHDRQAQLAATIQTIQELMAKNFQSLSRAGTIMAPGTTQQEEDDPSVGIATALVNTLHRRGVELARSLGTDASTGELIVLVDGSLGLGDYTTGEYLVQLAMKGAQNANDESIALRRNGLIRIQMATTLAAKRKGEESYNEAASLYLKYKSLPPYAVNFLKASAELEWADGIASYDCPGARQHFKSGIDSMKKNPPSSEMELMRRGVRLRFLRGIGGIEGCKPDPETTMP